jgi:hypothetical protein
VRRTGAPGEPYVDVSGKAHVSRERLDDASQAHESFGGCLSAGRGECVCASLEVLERLAASAEPGPPLGRAFRTLLADLLLRESEKAAGARGGGADAGTTGAVGGAGGDSEDITGDGDSRPAGTGRRRRRWEPRQTSNPLERAGQHSGRTMLHLATELADLELIRSLLERMGPDAEDADGRTALHAAAEAGDLTLVRELVAGANPANVNYGDRWMQTPLFYATFKGHAKVVRFLLDNGAHPDLLNSHGQSSRTVIDKISDAKERELIAAMFLKHEW